MRLPAAALALLSALAAAPLTPSVRADAPDRRPTGSAAASFARAAGSDVRFEENRGQSDPSVRFVARARGYTAFLTDRGVVFSLPDGAPSPEGHRRSRTAVRGASMEFVGGTSRPAGRARLEGDASYLIGRDRSRWVRKVPAFAGVRARGVWPGIDADWSSDRGALRYTFRAAPGADPGAMALRFEGITGATVDAAGDLLLATGAGTIRHSRPVAWQESGGIRSPVDASFDLRARGVVGFRFGTFDRGLPLVVDPRIDYSTYLGGSGRDEFTSVAVDSTGAVYFLGSAGSATLPVVGGFRGQADFAGNEVYLAKFAPGGSSLVYATYLGGSDLDYAKGIAVDSSGRAWVAGETLSTDFPTVAAYQGSLKGYYDAFLACISEAGDAVEVSTYFGGATATTAATPGSSSAAVALDSSGAAYLAGTTNCGDLPTKDPFQAAHGGQTYDSFVAKFTSSGALVYSSYLGGSQTDFARSVTVDGQGRAYVVGFNGGGTFPTVNGTQGIAGVGAEAFLSRVAADGKSLDYSFRWGGAATDEALAVRLGPGGDVYVVGTTESTDFPVVNPVMTVSTPYSGQSAAFLSRFSGDGGALLYSTKLGVNQTATRGFALAVDGGGGAWVGGDTNASSSFPKVGALQTTYAGGNADAFLMRLNASGSLLRFSTYLGGNYAETMHAIALDGSGLAWCAGTTNSTTFPTKDPLKASYSGGDADGFLTNYSFLPEAPTSLVATVISGTTVSLTWADNSTTETSFDVQRRPSGGAFATVLSVGAGITSTGDGGLSPLTSYEYRVRSVNDEGASPWSNTASVTTPDVPPATPSIVSAEPLSASTVRLTWLDTSSNETSFEVLHRVPGGTYVVTSGLPAGTTTHDVTGLLPSRTYGFSVRGRNAIGPSVPAAEVLASTLSTASFTVVKGTLKSSAKYLKDKVVVSGILATLENSPDGVRDPVADGIQFRFGGETAPFASVVVPAGSPDWAERKGKLTWKSGRGVLPKAVVTFVPETGAFSVALTRIDFAGTVAAPLAHWFSTGNDAGAGSEEWQEAKPGSWRFPAR